MKQLSFALAILVYAPVVFAAGRVTSPTTTAHAARTPVANTTSTVGARSLSTRGGTSNTTAAPAKATATTAKTVQRGRSATTTPTVARAAKQNVISTGTKVTAAKENTAVDPVCWEKFSGCMDSFCMLDNANGGRCICSDKNAEYDAILEEIQKLDEQSYQLATVGVERIEMGDAADAVMNKTNAVTKRVTADATKSKRQSLDLSSWNTMDLDFDAEAEDVFGLNTDGISIENKKGDALYRTAAKLCNEQITECKSQSTLMELMYKQRVRSDCTAYENSLRQQRTQSAQKLAAAQGAMREAALEQYRTANKYDLGQCTIEFKKCMQTTAGCGDDFTGCVDLAARANSELKVGSQKNKQKTIKGTSSKITITAETYDTLEAKKELCMSVTQQCVNVRNQVWDAFLREAAPQVKAAELIVESNLRTSCISNISNCFQKACRDTMDPNDPEGSYDMCLTRPDTLRSLCKVEIDPCEAAESQIMDYVRARLKSMRVDSCTKEFKECLQSEDRCGEDYTQCIGLDTDTIVRMCPADKLVGCKDEAHGSDDGDYVYDNLSAIAQGIFLSIDNNMLTACQKAVHNKVLEVCGSLSECDAFSEDNVIGTDSLATFKDSNGNIVIDGLMNFGLLTIKTNADGTIQKKPYELEYSELGKLETESSGVESYTLDRIKAAIQTVKNRAIQKMDALNADPTIDMCINGRGENWKYSKNGKGDASTDKFNRFPNLLDAYTQMVFNSAIDKAYLNYRAKYDEMVGKAVEDQNDDIKSALCAAMSYQAGAPVCEEYRAKTVSGDPVCKKYRTNSDLDSIFKEDVGTLGLDRSGTRYVLKTADLSRKLNTMSKGKGEFIQTDKEGNMLGSISMVSVYSPGTNVCTITTTTTMCTDVEMAITTDEYNCGGGNIVGIGGGCGQGGISVVGGYGENTVTQNYHGVYCSSYGEPVITTTEIKM